MKRSRTFRELVPYKSLSPVMSPTMSDGKPVSRKQCDVSDKTVDRFIGSLCAVVKLISREDDI